MTVFELLTFILALASLYGVLRADIQEIYAKLNAIDKRISRIEHEIYKRL